MDLSAKRLRRASRKKYRMTTSAYRREPYEEVPSLVEALRKNSPSFRRKKLQKLRKVLARSPKKPRKKVVAIVGHTTKNTFRL